MEELPQIIPKWITEGHLPFKAAGTGWGSDSKQSFFSKPLSSGHHMNTKSNAKFASFFSLALLEALEADRKEEIDYLGYSAAVGEMRDVILKAQMKDPTLKSIEGYFKQAGCARVRSSAL
jgi:hypothetical protein